ncbi:MAG: transglutaminase family protein [Chloroflexota bacterium]
MRVRVGCEFKYRTQAPVPMLMLVRARPDAEHETVYESQWTEPQAGLREYQDSFGNPCWRLLLPEGDSLVRYDAVVEVSPEPDMVVPDAPLVPVHELPDDTLAFTLPSRYIESDLLLDDAWRLFGDTPPTWARVQAVCDWVFQNIQYKTGSSGPSTTAHDVYLSRVGVCRDFAQISVALCRALNIPARYTFGYLPDIAVEPPDIPMDFHAWFEAYLGDRWYTFDARHNVPRVGRVKIAHGRDAVDVALSTAYGAVNLSSMVVWADEIAEQAQSAAPTLAGEQMTLGPDALTAGTPTVPPILTATVPPSGSAVDHQRGGSDAPLASAQVAS